MSIDRDLASRVLYQRTELLRLGHSPILRRLVPYRWLVHADATLFGRPILKAYHASMREHWESIAPHLPDTASRTLDIGCGIGAINVFLHQAFAAAGDVEHVLFDRDTEGGEVYYDFHARAAAYNDLSLTRAYLERHGVPSEAIRTVDVDREAPPDDITYDIVVSLISWGFHYPIETYADYVADHLAPGGVLILDVRRDTDGLEGLARRFDLEIVHETRKYDRVRATLTTP